MILTKEEIKLKAFQYRYFIHNIIKNEFYWWDRDTIQDMVGDVLEYFYNIVDNKELDNTGIPTFLRNLTHWLMANYRKRQSGQYKFDEVEYLYQRSKNENKNELLELKEKALEALDKAKVRSKHMLYTLKDVYLYLLKNDITATAKKFKVTRKSIYIYLQRMTKIPELKDYFEYIKEYETIAHNYYIPTEIQQRITIEPVNYTPKRKKRKYIKKEEL